MNWKEDTIVYKILMQSKSRVHTTAKIHEKLYESADFANFNLENYVADLVVTVSTSILGPHNDVTIDIDCNDVTLNINQALPCALIINELVTNAFKYAFEEGQNHLLEVKLRSLDGDINITVEDNGPGLPKNFEEMTENSLGHQLVNQLVKQLNGKIDVKSKKGEGTRYEIAFKKARKSGSSSNFFCLKRSLC